MTAIGRNWHPEHFVCTHCHENLKNKTFVEEKGKIYCEEDFVKLFADKCTKCGQNIGGVSSNIWRRGYGYLRLIHMLGQFKV